MNLPDNQTASGSVSPMAQFVHDELKKSGTRTWLGFPPPEEREQLRAEKAESDALALRKWLEAKDRRMAALKQAAMKTMRGEIDDE
jgi:hypothetical protein